MSRYITSLLLLASFICLGQEDTTTPEVTQDTLRSKKKYGVRVGLDLGNLIRTGVDDRYTGFQALVDYRFTDDIYFAGEIGNETFEESLERVDFKTSGSFIKAGLDYNFYDNWLEMDNMIYAGLRVGYANMSQELDRYRINTENTYLPSRNVFSNAEYSGLSAFWVELQAGIKVEVLTNLYLFANIQLRRMVYEDVPEGFDNLYVPGFGRTYDNGEIGAGYGYGIMYRISLFER